MDLILVGPGRAGLALSLASVGAGHRVVGVLARDPEDAVAAAERIDASPLSWDRGLPRADLLVVAVRDDAITEVAQRLSDKAGALEGAVHLSGLRPVAALAALEGPPLGSFHPLQTLPTPEAGAARLRDAWVAITSSDNAFADRLFAFAASLGAHPFELEDHAKPLYHAAAAAAANFTLAALALSRELFEAAGVDFTVAQPLIRAVVDNALDMGPVEALTGPVARGDVGTVRAQMEAIRSAAPHLAGDFAAMVRATARVAGTAEIIEGALS
ncbi:MAG TPA: DUF2520 domain-containing protein [Acidimicrobiia bacterium]|nr:DUF2520 domain-containing protein [Acidimicrobiia bacterium]